MKNSNKKYDDFIYKSKFNGIITDKYKDRHNHEAPVLNISNNGTLQKIFLIDIIQLWEFSEIGDSLLKNSNSETYYLIKNKNGESLKYQYEAKKIKTLYFDKYTMPHRQGKFLMN